MALKAQTSRLMNGLAIVGARSEKWAVDLGAFCLAMLRNVSWASNSSVEAPLGLHCTTLKQSALVSPPRLTRWARVIGSSNLTRALHINHRKCFGLTGVLSGVRFLRNTSGSLRNA